jgi:hypothetical protein
VAPEGQYSCNRGLASWLSNLNCRVFALACLQAARRPPFPRAELKYVSLLPVVFSGAKVCLELCALVHHERASGDAWRHERLTDDAGQTSLASMC